jgi:pantothenate kinase
MSEAPDSPSPHCARLRVAGYDVVVDPTPDELKGPIVDLFRIFSGLLQSVPVDRRAIIGLAGPPGSGKSTLAALLAYFSARVEPRLPALAVSVDGWHRRNDELAQMTIEDAAGQPMPLAQRKGSPLSFDVDALLADLPRMRQAHVPVRLPAYDRRLHEPVPDVLTVPPGLRLLLLEGNYVLLDRDRWADVYRQLDLGLYLHKDAPVCERVIIARHVRGGLSEEQARAKVTTNDRPNAAIVEATRHRADVMLYADETHHLVGVEPLTARAYRALDRFGLFPSLG